MMAKKRTSKAQPTTQSAKSDPLALRVTVPAGKTTEQASADLVTEGVVFNARLLREWVGGQTDQPAITELHAAMQAAGQQVKDGDLGGVERLLTSQLLAMNGIFANLMLRAHRAQYVEQYDLYLRLGFRCQSQCRATAETLAQMKMPPVFTKQANISNGPQQVNNSMRVDRIPPRAVQSGSAPNKLLEAGIVDGERVDGRAAGASGARDSAVEAVGQVNGTAHRRRQGARVAQRVPGRAARKRSIGGA